MKPARADLQTQRDMLASATRPGFFSSPAGLAFIEQVRHYLAPRLVKMSRSWGSYPIEFDEMVNLVLMAAVDLPEWKRHNCVYAESPWAYFSRCAEEWLWKEWGHRGTSLECMTWFNPPSNIVGPGEEDPRVEDERVMAGLARRVSAILLTRTPPHLHADVAALVEWLAWHPIQRLTYESQDRKEAAKEFPGLTSHEIRAVMNIVVGGRPVRERTSLFAMVALDPDFEPSTVPTIARALMHYRKAMSRRRPAQANRTLTEVAA